MPRGIKGSGDSGNAEEIDFENCPRYELGEKITQLRGQVENCHQMLGGLESNAGGLQKLAGSVAKLNGALLVLTGARRKKKRAPWGSKKKEKLAKK